MYASGMFPILYSGGLLEGVLAGVACMVFFQNSKVCVVLQQLSKMLQRQCVALVTILHRAGEERSACATRCQATQDPGMHVDGMSDPNK